MTMAAHHRYFTSKVDDTDATKEGFELDLGDKVSLAIREMTGLSAISM